MTRSRCLGIKILFTFFIVITGIVFCSVHSVWQSSFISQHIVVIESDDWGYCNILNKEYYENLKQKGYDLDSNIWNSDSLETEEDLELLFQILEKHFDSIGRHPILTANLVMSNPDFKKIKKNNYEAYSYISITNNSKFLIDKYNEGINRGIFFPEFHGREHFNFTMWLKKLQDNNQEALDYFGENAIPRGYPSEYIDVSCHPSKQFTLADQKERVEEGVKIFYQAFGYYPHTTMAPNGFWDEITERAWSESGIKYIQSGNNQIYGINKDGSLLKRRHKLGDTNNYGTTYLIRNCFFEPFKDQKAVLSCLKDIKLAFDTGRPAIIGSHRINYVSSVNPNLRREGIAELDKLLTLIGQTYPDVLYMTDFELGQIIKQGHSDLNIGGKNFTYNITASKNWLLKSYYIFNIFRYYYFPKFI